MAFLPLTPGGVPLTYDARDRIFDHGKFFGGAFLSQLPAAGLGRAVKFVVNQEWTTWCTGANTSRASAYMAGEDMSFEYQAAVIAYMTKQEVILKGADPRKAMQAACLYGSLPKRSATLSVDANGLEAGKIRNYPAPDFLEAAKNEEASFFWVHTGSYDAFDNIRMALWQAEQDALSEAKQAEGTKKEYIVMAFTQWYAEWTGSRKLPDGTYILETVPYFPTYIPSRSVSGFSPILNAIIGFFTGIFPSLFGGEIWHAWNIIDWVSVGGVEYLVGQNSYGAGYGGVNGTQLFSREIINATFADYRAGAAIFRDIDPKDVKSLAEQQSTLSALFKELQLGA